MTAVNLLDARKRGALSSNPPALTSNPLTLSSKPADLSSNPPAQRQQSPEPQP